MVTTRGQKRAQTEYNDLIAEASELLLRDDLSPRSRKDARILHTTLARTAYRDNKELANGRENLDIIKHGVEKSKHGVEKSKQIEELKASIKEVQLEKSVKTRAK